MGNENYSNVKLFILRTFLSIVGMFRCIRYKKGKTYYGGRNKRYGVYMGKKTFYEQFTVEGLGYCYYDNKPIKYKNWELGMWNWL